MESVRRCGTYHKIRTKDNGSDMLHRWSKTDSAWTWQGRSRAGLALSINSTIIRGFIAVVFNIHPNVSQDSLFEGRKRRREEFIEYGGSDSLRHPEAQASKPEFWQANHSDLSTAPRRNLKLITDYCFVTPRTRPIRYLSQELLPFALYHLSSLQEVVTRVSQAFKGLPQPLLLFPSSLALAIHPCPI